MMGFGEAVAKFYTGYFKFEGRASRAEYWWPFLMRVVVNIGIAIAFVSIFINTETRDVSGGGDVPAGFWGLIGAYFLFGLFNFIPTLAVSVRRFHDLDQTGWLVLVFVLVNAFLIVTVFAQLIWFALRGTDGPNQYGPDPFGFNPELFG